MPPPKIRALRDLTRTRVSLVQTRTQAKNRVYKILKDTNLKLAVVVSNLFGKSARQMLDALVAGERDPQKLSAMALGTLRRKIPQPASAGCHCPLAALAAPPARGGSTLKRRAARRGRG